MEIVLSVADAERVQKAYAKLYGWSEETDDISENIKSVLIDQMRLTVEQVEDADIVSKAREENKKDTLIIT